MSTEAVNWAMDDAPMLLTDKGKPDTTARHVLQVLGEHAWPDGSNAYPTIGRIQYRSGYNRSTVQRALRRLVTGGLIRATGENGGRTVWQLALHLKRPASDWDDIERAEDEERKAAAARQRRVRSKRVTHAEVVTEADVTDAESVTGVGVTDSASVSHASKVRDVTHAESECHARSAAQTVNEPSLEPSENPANGRRPTTGSGERAASGSAAFEDEPLDEENVTTSAIGRVVGELPERLREQLPEFLPTNVIDTIRGELRRGITADQLVQRASRRWVEHRYSDAASPEMNGVGLFSPVGVAVALLRASNCTDPRCEDKRNIDSGAACRTCERDAHDRAAAAASEPRQNTFPVLVAGEPIEEHRPDPLQTCDGCERAFRAPEPGGLCGDCRRERTTTA